MADLSQLTTIGGQYTTPVVAVSGTSGAAYVVSAVPGRLCRITVTAAGTGAALALYDHASAASGTVLFSTAATTQTVGTLYDVEMPAANGIVASGTTGTPGVTVSYTKDTAYGR